MKRKVLIIYTGGTIGMEKDYDTGSLKPFDFSKISTRIQEINELECDLALYQFEEPLDSSDVGPRDWIQIAEVIGSSYEDFDGFLILHGTDTMAYTASALSFMLKGLRKPVILTGSQLPIGHLRTDAKENLLTSLYYASYYENDEAVIQEVSLYFEYKLLRGNRCTKVSVENFNAFKTPNYPILGESGVNLDIFTNELFRPAAEEAFHIDTHLSKDVILLWAFPGMNLEEIGRFLVASQIKVIVLTTFGSGTFFSDTQSVESLRKIKAHGIEIVVTTQCISGEIMIGKYENSNIFTEIGATNGHDLTIEAALAKAMHIYGNPVYKGLNFKDAFEQDLRGEVSINTEANGFNEP